MIIIVIIIIIKEHPSCHNSFWFFRWSFIVNRNAPSMTTVKWFENRDGSWSRVCWHAYYDRKEGGLSSGWSLLRVVFTRLIFRLGGLSLGWYFIRTVLHQGGLSSGWSFLKAVFRHGGPLSRRSFIMVVLYQGGLSSWWSFIKEVFHQGCPSSRWPLLRVVLFYRGGQSGLSPGRSFLGMVFHEGGLLSEWFFVMVVLSSGWSFIRWSFIRATYGHPRKTKAHQKTNQKNQKKANFNSIIQKHTFSQSHGSSCPTVMLLRTPCFTLKLDTGFFSYGVSRPQKP